MTRHLSKILLLAVIGFTSWLGFAKAQEVPKPNVKIGMLKTMLRGISPAMFAAVAAPFSTLVKTQTGLDGELVMVETPEEMRQGLVTGSLQLGAFHGFEFAWMKLKEPQLEPLMLAAVNPNSLKAIVVVKKDEAVPIKVEQLQGKSIAVPTSTREHCRLFLHRRCCPRGCKNMQDHFSAMPAPTTAEDAMDDVVEGKTHAAVVDMASLKMYERRKPGRFNNLQVIESSDMFPASVIAANSTGLDAVSARKFQNGMATAHKSMMGAQLMGLMKIQAFEPVPANYDQVMAEITKAYPPPWIVAQK